MKQIHELRELADHAKAESSSGVVSSDLAQSYLDGVEEALRWAAGDGTSTEIHELVDRMAEVDP